MTGMTTVFPSSSLNTHYTKTTFHLIPVCLKIINIPCHVSILCKMAPFFFLLIKLVFEMKLICPTQTGLDLTHDLTFHVIFCFLISSVSGMRCPYSARRQFTDSFYMASSVYDSFSTRRVTSTSGPSVPNPFLLSGGPPIPLLSIPPLPHPLLWSYS